MENITFTMNEQAKIITLAQLCNGQISNSQASIELGLSIRQTQRKKKAYLENGAVSVKHGNLGKKSSRSYSDKLKEKIVSIYKNEYYGWNYSHFNNELEDYYNIIVSRQFVYRLLTERIGPSPQAKKHKPKSHPPRDRKEYAGELIQVDASKHHWLEGDGNYYYLHGSIDDATGIVTACVLMEEECILGYQIILKDTMMRYGIPKCLYTDYRTVFQSPKKLSLEEQIDGKEVEEPRYVQMLRRNRIDIISTTNPRAKGRIERLWRTFQDRLVKELAKKHITTKEEANHYINEVFLPKYNARFASKINYNKNMFRPVLDNFNYNLELAITTKRKVLHNSYIKLDGQYYVIYKDSKSQFIHSRESDVVFLLNGEKKLRVHDVYYDLVPVTKMHKPQKKITQTMTKEELARKRSKYGKKGAQNSPWKHYIARDILTKR